MMDGWSTDAPASSNASKQASCPSVAAQNVAVRPSGSGISSSAVRVCCEQCCRSSCNAARLPWRAQ